MKKSMKKLRKAVPMVVVLLAIAAYMTGCGASDKKDTASGTTDSAAESKDAAAGAKEEAAEEASFGTFTTVDLDGQAVTQTVFKDAKVTMVNVWGTFCGPCINEMPDLGALAAEYKDKELQIIGIPIDVSEEKNEDTARDIVQQTGADYVHMLPSEELNKNILSGVQVVPTTIFVDQDGKVKNVYTGARSKDDWMKIMDEELGQ
ncbi:MAG: TlpA disulfide reductase family protein [Hespellia sp.]|nr:TlpA disulfide reductase family protein [Hespellia sp.]